MGLSLTVALCGLLGLFVGGYVNGVVGLCPLGAGLLVAPWHGSACVHPLQGWQRVPVLGWLLGRGRCRQCPQRTTVRQPLVELATAGVFALLATRIGTSSELPAFLYLGAVAVALALIDLDVRRLPDAIVLPSYPIAFGLLLVPALVHDDLAALGGALAGAALLFAFYFVLAFANPAGMGFGDVKLSGVLGAYLGWLGWWQLLAGAFLGFLLGATVGVALVLARRATRKSSIPFGPFMLAGALLTVLWSGGHVGAPAL